MISNNRSIARQTSYPPKILFRRFDADANPLRNCSGSSYLSIYAVPTCGLEIFKAVKQPPAPGDIHDVSRRALASSQDRTPAAIDVDGHWKEQLPESVSENRAPRPSQMPLVQRDQVVQALAPNRANHPFAIGIRHRAPKRCLHTWDNVTIKSAPKVGRSSPSVAKRTGPLRPIKSLPLKVAHRFGNTRASVDSGARLVTPRWPAVTAEVTS